MRKLDEQDYRADRGLFFGSVHGTLNHLLVGDRLWFHRITGEATAPLPASLDDVIEDDREALLRARANEDARIMSFATALGADRLAGDLDYTNVAGERFRQPLALILAHVFNHQTHHRGQIHAALTGFGAEAPALDLIYYLREL